MFILSIFNSNIKMDFFTWKRKIYCKFKHTINIWRFLQKYESIAWLYLRIPSCQWGECLFRPQWSTVLNSVSSSASQRSWCWPQLWSNSREFSGKGPDGDCPDFFGTEEDPVIDEPSNVRSLSTPQPQPLRHVAPPPLQPFSLLTQLPLEIPVKPFSISALI